LDPNNRVCHLAPQVQQLFRIDQQQVHRGGGFVEQGFADHICQHMFPQSYAVKDVMDPQGLYGRSHPEFKRSAPAIRDEQAALITLRLVNDSQKAQVDAGFQAPPFPVWQRAVVPDDSTAYPSSSTNQAKRLDPEAGPPDCFGTGDAIFSEVVA
jgi:hypothetical protein